MLLQGFSPDADLIPWSQIVISENIKKKNTFLKTGNFNALN